MKKVKTTSEELRAEYRRSDFKKLERGMYYESVRASSNVVVLDDDWQESFPTQLQSMKSTLPRKHRVKHIIQRDAANSAELVNGRGYEA
jgi:hypothetical protein